MRLLRSNGPLPIKVSNNRKISILTSKLNIEIRKKWLGLISGENWSGSICRALKCSAGGKWRR